jgi:HSP20 family molecular chaperone IbpA
MALPAGVDPKKIKATTRDGVVEVTVPLPKEPEKKRSRSRRPRAECLPLAGVRAG